jgi:hypothetical protein
MRMGLGLGTSTAKGDPHGWDVRQRRRVRPQPAQHEEVAMLLCRGEQQTLGSACRERELRAWHADRRLE